MVISRQKFTTKNSLDFVSLVNKTNIMSSKFFGNSKAKTPKQEQGKKMNASKNNRKITAVRKTGRGK